MEDDTKWSLVTAAVHAIDGICIQIAIPASTIQNYVFCQVVLDSITLVVVVVVVADFLLVANPRRAVACHPWRNESWEGHCTRPVFVRQLKAIYAIDSCHRSLVVTVRPYLCP